MIKCIIFDCDGTLVDSEVLFNRALSIKLHECGIELTSNQLVSRFRGVQLTTVLTIIQSEFGIDLDDDFVAGYRNLVNDFFEKELKPCEGVSQTLTQIDLPMCVATNGPLPKMKLALNVTNLASHFGDNLFSAYDVGAWKPDPQLFLFTAKSMGFKPNECLVVEDSRVGIEAAIAGEMNAVLYDHNGVHNSIDGVKKITQFSELLTLV